MARAAGDSPNYTFVLKNKVTGEFDESHSIELPSVTTIIKRNLAAPALVNWAYRQTIESIEILMDVYNEDVDMHNHDLDALLRENRLHPDDIRDEAAGRGRGAHEWLERHAAGMEESPTMDMRPSYLHAITNWWRTTHPKVIASEVVLYSLRYGYAGTCDLVWQDFNGEVVLTDLKTRDNSWTQAYDSDLIQVAAYKEAWNEMHPEQQVDNTSVLIARPDSSFIEDYRSVPFSTFEALLAVDRDLKGVR